MELTQRPSTERASGAVRHTCARPRWRPNWELHNSKGNSKELLGLGVKRGAGRFPSWRTTRLVTARVRHAGARELVGLAATSCENYVVELGPFASEAGTRSSAARTLPSCSPDRTEYGICASAFRAAGGGVGDHADRPLSCSHLFRHAANPRAVREPPAGQVSSAVTHRPRRRQRCDRRKQPRRVLDHRPAPDLRSVSVTPASAPVSQRRRPVARPTAWSPRVASTVSARRRAPSDGPHRHGRRCLVDVT